LRVKKNPPANSLFEPSDLVSSGGRVNKEFKYITHFWTSVVVCDGLSGKHRIRIPNLGIKVSKKHRRQNIHLLNHILPQTSNGWNTKTNTMASNTVFNVFPKMNTKMSTWDETNTRSCVVATSKMSSQITTTTTNRITSIIRCSLLTALFVSPSDNAKARLSWYTFT
jgi:hypothetical protein